MPTTTIPSFKAKISCQNSAGMSAIHFTAKHNGTTYTVSPGLSVLAKDWQPNAAGKGNGRAKRNGNEPLNGHLEKLQVKLRETWQAYPNVTPERFRQLVLSEPRQAASLTTADFMEYYVRDPHGAMRILDELGERQKTYLLAFVKTIFTTSPQIKVLALGNTHKMKNLHEYVQEYIEKGVGDGYKALQKHMLAFEQIHGKYDFDSIDWTWRQAFVDFLYTEQEFEMQTPRGIKAYRKNALQQGSVSQYLTLLTAILNRAKIEKISTQDIQEHPDFGVTQPSGNGCPLFLDDLEKILSADLSADPLMEQTRTLVIIGFCTAARRSDWAQIMDTAKILKVEGQDVIEFQQKKTGDVVAVPVSPLLAKALGKKVKVPAYDQLLTEHFRQLVLKTGIDRELEFTSYKGGVMEKYKTRLSAEFSPHDLRRSAATFMLRVLGIEKWRVMLLTGHKSEAMLDKYIFTTSNQLNAASLSKMYKKRGEKILGGEM